MLIERPAPAGIRTRLDVPGSDSEVSISDVREIVRRLREYAREYSELAFLVADVPPEFDPDKPLSVPEIIELGPRVSRAEKERAFARIQAIYNARAEALNEQLAAGSISLDTWERSLRDEIKFGHVSTYSAGRSGSWSSISFAEWGRLGQRIRRQYQFLKGFAADIRAKGDEGFTVEYLNNRASLYADNMRESLEAGIARDRGLDPGVLPAMPGDGSTKCLTRCKCRWRIRAAGRDRWLVSWILGRADHCSTCNDRSEDWVNLEVYRGSVVSPVVPHFYNR